VGCPSKIEVSEMQISPFALSILYDNANDAKQYTEPHSGKAANADADADVIRQQKDENAIKRFKAFVSQASDEAIDLLIHLLHFDANIRISAKDALEHPYIAQFHDPSVERTAAKVVQPNISDDEKKSTNFYREKLYSQLKTGGDGRSGGQESRRGDGRSGGQESRRGPSPAATRGLAATRGPAAKRAS